MDKEKTIKYRVKEGGETVAEFWIYAFAQEYVERFGGKIYKIITTTTELEEVGNGVWA